MEQSVFLETRATKMKNSEAYVDLFHLHLDYFYLSLYLLSTSKSYLWTRDCVILGEIPSLEFVNS